MNNLVDFSTTTDALKFHISRYSVALLMDAGGDIPAGGSGTCVQVNGKCGIFTAAHLFDGIEAEQISILYSSVKQSANRYVRNVRRLGGGDFDNIDVAFLELTSEGYFALRKHKEFLPLDRMRPGVFHAESRFLVFGCPFDLVDRAALDDLVYASVSMLYVTVSLDDVPDNRYEKSTNIILDYPSEGNFLAASRENTDRIPDPEGMSGAGIWIVSRSTDKLWTPSTAKLVGVQGAWLRSRRLLIGTQVQFAIKLTEPNANGI